MASMINMRGEHFQGGYTIMGRFADLMFSSEPLWKEAGMREGFSGMETSACGSLCP